MISVCMATYNGSKYIEKQLISILSQLNDADEIIIFDDSSDDNTIEIIKNFNDPRIRLHINEENSGVIRNFERAIYKANGDFIFLSDQDDIWYDNKVKKYIEQFEMGYDLIISDLNLIDEHGDNLNKTFYSVRGYRHGIASNLFKNSFIGCSMAFNRKIKNNVLPFPKKLPMHDSWIGLNALLYGNVKFINEPTMGYRRHGSNVTSLNSTYNLSKIITDRYILAKSLLMKRKKL